MSSELSASLTAFVAWCGEHIRGDEKGEAQLFLDHLFRAFGHAGLKEVGATCKDRVKKEGGGTAFADLVWKPVVLVEMKKRGTDLSKHYRQAFDYWTRLVPGRPRFVVLCNFDEFWIYDFETQMDAPVDTVALSDLPQRWGPLAFLGAVPSAPTFGNNHEEVTRQAADLLAAYGFSAKGDLLQQLLNLNRAVAEKLGAGDTATGPGLPPYYPDSAGLVTPDCLGA